MALVGAELAAFLNPGNLIWGPFGCSGTQLVAAERAARPIFAIELNPVYFDHAVRRREMETERLALIL